MTVRPENLSKWSSIWPNLQSGQLLYRVHQAASANCLNFQKLAGQAALKIVKTSDKTPNIVNFIIPVGIPLKKLRPEKFENTNDKTCTAKWNQERIYPVLSLLFVNFPLWMFFRGVDGSGILEEFELNSGANYFFTWKFIKKELRQNALEQTADMIDEEKMIIVQRI